MIALLVTKGANVHDAARTWTPFHIAVRYGSVEAMRALLDAGADPNECNALRYSMIHVAAESNNATKLAMVIAAGTDVNATTTKQSTPLHFATRVDNATTIDILIDCGAAIGARDFRGLTPLTMAAALLNPRAASALVKHGADVHTKDNAGHSPLVHAVVRAGGQGSADLVDLFLRSGCDEKQIPAGTVGKLGLDNPTGVRTFSLIEEFNKVRTLLMNAPADRAWRRRAPVVLDRSRFLKFSGVRVKMNGDVVGLQGEAWVGATVWLMRAPKDVFGEIIGFV